MARRSLQLAGLVVLALLGAGGGATGCAGCGEDAAPVLTCSELHEAWQARADELSTLCTFDDDCAVIGQLQSDCEVPRGTTSGCGLAVRAGSEADPRLQALEVELRQRCNGDDATRICDCGTLIGRCLLARCRAEFLPISRADAGP